ncbi:MAG: rhodanese-like domain-containing protein [Clostridia bacterium]|nr:rhodanese-like domain-containing protein [Clostridia bacterium]
MRIILPMLLMLILGISIFIPPQASANSYRQLSMQDAIHMMEVVENYVILDVRTAEEYQSGHIPGAVNLPNETIFKDNIPELPDKDQLILVYCRSGNRSRQAAAKLASLGYTNIVEFGGIRSWPGEIVIP